jgi:hypothetical protein
MKLLSLLAAAGVCALPSGCSSSPPARFHALAPVAPEKVPPSVSGAPVRVAPVRTPAVLDRQELVRRTSATGLEVSAVDRWGAPLAEMVREVLTLDLAERLPEGMVVFPDEPAPPEVGAVVVDILRFDRDAAGEVELVASWSLLPGGSAVATTSRQVRLTEPGAEGYADQARAMSSVLGRLADDIAAALAAGGSDGGG